MSDHFAIRAALATFRVDHPSLLCNRPNKPIPPTMVNNVLARFIALSSNSRTGGSEPPDYGALPCEATNLQIDIHIDYPLSYL